MKGLKTEPGSFRDLCSKEFYLEDKILRLASHDGVDMINFFLKNNLLKKLISQNYLIDSKITNQYDSSLEKVFFSAFCLKQGKVCYIM